MALKSSLLWLRRNCRKTSSRFFTSRGPRTIRADFCGAKAAAQRGPQLLFTRWPRRPLATASRPGSPRHWATRAQAPPRPLSVGLR